MTKHWAIFCRVVDNYGDIGVCWRLAAQLAHNAQEVTLYVDDASVLAWLAPQGCTGVSVKQWPTKADTFSMTPPQVVIEAFACELPAHVQAAIAALAKPPVWINLEYFSAEDAAVRNHGLPSPIQSGPAKGMTKWFFYPGLDKRSGGLLHGPSRTCTLSPSAQASHTLRISVFCYEPASLHPWLAQLSESGQAISLQVAHGRTTDAVKQAWQACHALGVATRLLRIDYLPALSQDGYDALLASCDVNLVRGEDSLVRAVWAGKAFLWHIYPQDDGAHMPKLQAFLDATQAPPLVVQAHRAWNATQPTALPTLSSSHLQVWDDWAKDLRLRLSQQTDLLTRLQSFVAAQG